MSNYSIATWIAATAVLLLTLALIVMPLLSRREQESPVDERRALLLQEQQALLAQLRALEEDHRTGKIADVDYASLRAGLIARGAAVLRSLAELDNGPAV